jgi:hypothetical protein
MALEKLRIKPLPPSSLREVSVLFNPNAYVVVKPVTWSAPRALMKYMMGPSSSI